MSINPEFRRNLWLELSPQRLIGMPFVLGALFLLAFALSGKRFGEDVAHTALVLFGVLAIVWGTKLAGESVVTEIRERTWDGQRMSVIGPWAMTWGKLFGSTIFPWYGALLCLIVYAVVVPFQPGTDIFKTVLVMAGAGLAGQAVALLASLLAIRRARRFSRSQASAFSVLGLLTAFPVLSLGFQGHGYIQWYGNSFLPINFTLLSLALFLSWAVIGIYRLMRLELQMKNPPWVWLGFVIFLMAYMAGFSLQTVQGISAGPLSRCILSAYITAVALTYLTALAEPKDPIRFRRLIRAVKIRDWSLLLQGCPSWAMVLPLLCVAAIMLFAFPLTGISTSGSNFRIAVVSSLFFILRDLALLLFFNLSRNPKRADMLAMLWLGLLWLVIPLTLSGLGFDNLTQFFLPRPDVQPLVSLVAAPCELLLVAWLVVGRWKANFG